jgi:hypothetical protein
MIAGLARRIDRLNKDTGRQAGFMSDPSWYAFRVAPSCPPDKQVHMRGGLGFCGTSDQWDPFSRRAYQVPNLTADLADTDSVETDITFVTANYYLAYVLLLRLPEAGWADDPSASDWCFRLVGSGTEFATAAEAENDMEEEAMWQQYPWASGGTTRGYPLCGLVLRNDGTVGNGAPILPVDVVNRGRSYMWPRDIRPRWSESW